GPSHHPLPALLQAPPPGNPDDVPVDLDAVFEQAALGEQWSGERRQSPRAGVGTGGSASVEPAVELAGPGAAEQRPVAFGGALVEVGRPPTPRPEARPATTQTH